MDEKTSNKTESQDVFKDMEKAAPPQPQDEEEDEFPRGVKVFIIMLAVWLSMFLVALVRTTHYYPLPFE